MTFWKWTFTRWHFYVVFVALFLVIEGFAVSQGYGSNLSLGGLFGNLLMVLIIYLIAYNIKIRFGKDKK